MKIKLLFLILFSTLLSFAQNPAEVENTFEIHPGFDGFINSTVIQPDGKIIVGGSFSKFQGEKESNIVRINVDGSRDVSFINAATPFIPSNGIITNIPYEINCLALQKDGKILFGHNAGLKRLLNSGLNDSGFKADFSSDERINAIALQPDGKIIVVGGFHGYEGSNIHHIVRLNPDGSRDVSFNVDINLSDNTNFYTVELQPDGKIIIGGDFSGQFKGGDSWYYSNKIARLNTDGSFDITFKTSFGLGEIYSLKTQTDGKILVGGDYSYISGTIRSYYKLIRLNPDGSMDDSFNLGVKLINTIKSIAIQSDEKIIVGSNYYANSENILERGLIRLNSDGSKDNSFKVDVSENLKVNNLNIQTDGKIIVAGNFTEYQGFSKFNMARINPDGSNDSSFNQGTGLNNTVLSIVPQTDNKIIVAGDFTSYQGISQNRLVRLNSDKSKDTSFNIGTGFDNTVNCMAIQPDGKIIVGGVFTKYKGLKQEYLIRLNTDGSKDTSFNIGTGFSRSNRNFLYIKSIAIQPDGKIIIGGHFGGYQGLNGQHLTRLNSDGSIDPFFDVGTGFYETVNCTVIQPDGKIIVGGSFTYYQGWSPANYLIRLNSDGSRDTSFNSNISSAINAIALQSDGKIIVGGGAIRRLNADGSIDSSFNIGTGFYTDQTAPINSIVLQKNGKIIVGGYFTHFQGVQQNNLICLNSDGSKDITFEIGTGFQKSVYDRAHDYGVNSIALQANGEIFVGGNYTLFNGQKSAHLVNLKGNFTPISIDATTTQTNLTCPGSSEGSASIVSVYNGKAPYTYLWSNGATTSTITELTAGDYSCTITDADAAKVTKSFTIIEYIDLQKPTITAPAKITVNTNADCTATEVELGTPVTADNCSIVSITNNAPSIFPLGTTLVTWTVKDANNNTATATQIVSVNDVTLPTITAPAAVTVNTNTNCTAIGVVLGTPVTADNCSISSVTNNAPSVFPLGNTTVTWTVKDKNYNTATATQIVTVKDIILPTITAPTDKTVNTTSNCNATRVVLGTPTTSDNCTVTSISNDAPTTFPLGNTTVTWTVKDASNNIATATQIITVKDVTKPTITAPPTVIVNANSNGTATGVKLGTPVTADNCSVASVTNDAPTTFPLGNTVVTWTVKDASNNIATATQIITVKGATPPTLIPVAIFTASTTAANTNESINFKDNSINTPTSWAWEITKTGSATLTSSLQNPTFNFVDPGTYTVKLTATNGAGSNTITVTNMITIFISLPSNNFTIESKGETCLNQNNGEINIVAKASYNYVATINGTKYPLVNNSLKVANLAPATYYVSIGITGELFEQNYTVTIPKGATITAKSTIDSRLASVEISEGTAPYTVFVNGEEQFETASDTFSVSVNKGDFLEIKTAKACEGIYLKEIDTDLLESVFAHPNPTNGKFEIEVPISVKKVVIDLYTMDSKIISKKMYTPTNGRVPFNIENQASGVYIAKIYLIQPKYLKIIKK